MSCPETSVNRTEASKRRMKCCLPSDALAQTFLYLHEMEAIYHTCDRAVEDIKRRNGGKEIVSALHQSYTPFVDLPPDDFTSHYR
jgi:hypothetical protein